VRRGRPLVPLIAAVAVVPGCGARLDPAPPGRETPSAIVSSVLRTATPFRAAPEPSASLSTGPLATTAVATPTPSAWLPDPETPIPPAAGPLASLLTRTTRALNSSIRAWRAKPGVLHPPPRAVVLQALLHQRIYRVLGRDPALAAQVIAALPADLRPAALSTCAALSRLFAQVQPVPSAAPFRTGPPEPPGALLRYYQEAEQRFGVDWELLAAVNFIESKFGRSRSTSTAGAQGPMQFIPSTWEAYGLGGDVDDPHDAILGAANYLHASGAPGDDRRALFAYNQSDNYVEAVLQYAEAMRRDPTQFLVYYSWQVFVVTTAGDVRLTGPGAQGT
jgi:hypothetical protein